MKKKMSKETKCPHLAYIGLVFRAALDSSPNCLAYAFDGNNDIDDATVTERNIQAWQEVQRE